MERNIIVTDKQTGLPIDILVGPLYEDRVTLPGSWKLILPANTHLLFSKKTLKGSAKEIFSEKVLSGIAKWVETNYDLLAYLYMDKAPLAQRMERFYDEVKANDGN